MVEFQYFEECPNAAATLDNLRDLIVEKLFGESDLSIIEVPTPDLAEELNFQGSPTVLVNGVDVYTEKVPDGYSFNCRIFEIDGAKTGVLSKEYLRTQYQKIVKK